ncbi:MAG TPA: cupin domain-containing protein [Spirochaetia bacterium]|nr:cupin domain-containing protein [Spirochaetia bacterium]
MPYFSWRSIPKDVEPGQTLPAGMSRQATVVGETMLALHEAFPNLKCKPHRHASAQTTYMLKGKLKMRIGKEVQVIEPGEFAYVPANVEHSIESLDEYVLALDIFAPPRPDILERLRAMDSEPAKPRKTTPQKAVSRKSTKR